MNAQSHDGSKLLKPVHIEPVGLVIIGHLAHNEDRTSSGVRVSTGGAAYYCAVGSSVIAPATIGIVSCVGPDFNLRTLRRLGVQVDGVTMDASGYTARFTITQMQDGSRTFDANWGVASSVCVDTYPDRFMHTCHVHIATAPPWQQVEWIQRCRLLPSRPTISIDTFEHFARISPEECRQAIAMADMIFANEEEAMQLEMGDSLPGKALILKRGPHGARYSSGSTTFDVPAPSVPAVETTGAGDLLAGAFLSLRTQGVSAAQALREAVELASASVRDFGVDHFYVDEERRLVQSRHRASPVMRTQKARNKALES